MKQAKLLALTICLVLLCGCSASAKYKEQFQSWRGGFLSLESHEIEAVITTSGQDTISDYTLLYTSAEDGSQTVEVLAPALVAKIRASIEKDGAKLSFDGAILETGEAITEGLSPLMSLPRLLEALKEGHIEASWRESREGIYLVVTELELPNGTILSFWQEEEGMRPVYAELRGAEQTELKMSFTKFR